MVPSGEEFHSIQ